MAGIYIVSVAVISILVALVIWYHKRKRARPEMLTAEQTAARQQYTARYSKNYESLSRTRQQIREALERAMNNPGFHLDANDVMFLTQIRTEIAHVADSIGDDNRLMHQYWSNLKAIISYVLWDTGEKDDQETRLTNALHEMDVIQNAERSGHPLAVLERNAALGLGPVDKT